jgi:hypothetical protein
MTDILVSHFLVGDHHMLSIYIYASLYSAYAEWCRIFSTGRLVEPWVRMGWCDDERWCACGLNCMGVGASTETGIDMGVTMWS